MANDKLLMNARCLLLAKKPWYGHAAATMNWIADESVGTMAVCPSKDGRSSCFYAPSFVRKCTPGELAAVIEHEIEHVLRRHCMRRSARDRLLFNVACDMLVNGHQSHPMIGIENPKTGRPEIPNKGQIVWLPESWPLHMTAEQCYRRLVDEQDVAKLYGVNHLITNHDWWPAATAEVLDRAVNTFAAACTSAGVATPDAVGQYLPSRKKSVPWELLLRRFVARHAGGAKRSDYRRRSRRVDLFGVPGRKTTEHCRFSVVVDISYSVSNEILFAFFTELELLSPLATFCVLTWSDAMGTFLDPYRAGDWRQLSRTTRGGTDMIAPVEWLRKRGKLGDGILMLTDGYCYWPPPQPVPLLVLCSTTSSRIVEPPWGKIVYLDPV